MAIDFESMNVGDEVMMPSGKWNDSKREYYNLAAEFARTKNPEWQFEVTGYDSNGGQYKIRRIK